MHNHNNDKGGGHWGMMWMMIPCLLLLGFLFLGDGRFPASKYFWVILVVIGVCVGPHLWMMLKGHRNHTNSNDKPSDEEKKS
jgi:formate hydrogenlyase subunit 3/multisubunit Na+/H+ antiporter MnhD subunit